MLKTLLNPNEPLRREMIFLGTASSIVSDDGNMNTNAHTFKMQSFYIVASRVIRASLEAHSR